MESVFLAEKLCKGNIKDRARQLNFVAIEKDEYENLLSQSTIVDEEKVKSFAKDHGITILPTDEYQKLQEQKTDSKDVTSSTSVSAITKDVVINNAGDRGMVTLSTFEHAELTKPLEIGDLKEKAKDFDMILVDKDEYDHLLEIGEQFTDGVLAKEEVIERAHEYGLVALGNEQFEKIKEELAAGGRNLTQDDIMMKSAEFGLVPIQKEQFEQIKKELENPTFSREQIVENAGFFDLIAIDIKEYKRLKKQSHISALDADDDDDDDYDDEESEGDNFDFTDSRGEIKELYTAAKRFGLLCIPESAFVATSVASTPDVSNVVVLPITYYNKLLSKEQESWEKITDDELQAEARKRGFQVGLNIKKDYDFNNAQASTIYRAHSRTTKQSTNRSVMSAETNTRRS